MTASAPAVRVAVIMAGGSGERFWPLSRAKRPKQLLRLANPDATLLQDAVERIAPLIPADRLYVQTTRDLREPIRVGEPRLCPENVLAEPCRRNTTGCLVWAAASIAARHPQAADVTMAVLTADHRIGAPEQFRATVDEAMAVAERRNALVTIGIRPERPDSAYGYIEVAPDAPPTGAVQVRRFREKPGPDLAEEFLRKGHFHWNSGMFFWRVSTFFRELAEAQPELGAHAHAVRDRLRAGDEEGAAAAFAKMESISVDYALMERSRNVLVLPASFPWDDVGSWDSLERTLRESRDPHGNIVVGNPVVVDSRDCIVYDDATPGARAVAVVGCEDIVVIHVDDAVLVVDKTRVQDVRKAVEELKKRGAKQI